MKVFFNKKSKYYVEVCRYWESHSYDTTINMVSYAHPIFLIKKRRMFGKDRLIKVFYYTDRIEDALDEVRKLNGEDYIPNEQAYNTNGVFVERKNPSQSGIYVKKN